jgi:hypothetical protein
LNTPTHLRRALSDLDVLLSGFRGCIDAVAKHYPIPEGEAWRNDGQVLLIKGHHHLQTIRELATGRNIAADPRLVDPYVDHGSIGVLGRAAFECLLLFHFIFIDSSAAMQELRFSVWKYVGIRSRTKLQGFQMMKGAVEKVRKEDMQRLHELQEAIEGNELFMKMDKNVRHNALHKDGVRLGHHWTDIAQRAGMPRIYAADMYRHLCEYTHSGPVSAWQIRDASADKSGETLASGVITFCTMLLNETMITYARRFPPAHRTVFSDADLITAISVWRQRRNAVKDLPPGFEPPT